MKLTPAQFGALHTLAEHGPKEAVEVAGPPGMDGRRKVKLQWNVASAPTLAALEGASLVSVMRGPAERPTDAVGRRGNARRKLVISITSAGRSALAAD